MTPRPRPGGVAATCRLDLGWQDEAACHGLGDLFFGPDGEADAQRAERERRAKRVCGGCKVIAECRAFADALPVDLRKHSVFGGIAETDRRRLVRRQAAMRRRDQEQEVAA